MSSFDFLAAQMADHETGWSLGTFGAIAEFTRDPDEPTTLSRTGTCLAAVTARGGVRVEPCEGMRLFASETTTRESWNHRIALCLPEDACAMNRRAVLTELGPDTAALREQDRGAALFDLGLDALQADLCVRVADQEVAAQLRSHCGWALFAPGNPAIRVILAASPHRVFVSRLGRIEVFQPIPAAEGSSPDGPHTHVLPKLLAHRRAHAATEQVPDGFIPCAHLYPAHPAKDASGRARPFDGARHDAFQQMLRDFGDPRTRTPSSSACSRRWPPGRIPPSSHFRAIASCGRMCGSRCGSSRRRTSPCRRSRGGWRAHERPGPIDTEHIADGPD